MHPHYSLAHAMLILLDPLAYMVAKAHGLEEECQSILEVTGLEEDQLSLPEFGEALELPTPVVPTHQANWPTKATSQSFFEKALAGQLEGMNLEDEPAAEANGFDDEMGGVDNAAKENGAMDVDDDEKGDKKPEESWKAEAFFTSPNYEAKKTVFLLFINREFGLVSSEQLAYTQQIGWLNLHGSKRL